MKKPTDYTLLPALVVLLLLPVNSFSQTCEKELSYCRNTIRELVDPAHFNKKTTRQEFVNWWNRKWIHGRPLGIIKADYHLDKIKPSSAGKMFNTYTLPGDTKISVIIEIPTEKPGEEYPAKCASNTARLKASLKDEGLSINLNPHCSESYGQDEVSISLYWISLKNKPLVEIVTNGPACVPAMLYIYNETSHKYELAAKKCGG